MTRILHQRQTFGKAGGGPFTVDFPKVKVGEVWRVRMLIFDEGDTGGMAGYWTIEDGQSSTRITPGITSTKAGHYDYVDLFLIPGEFIRFDASSYVGPGTGAFLVSGEIITVDPAQLTIVESAQ
jgi:hypothetical protein